MRKMLVALSVLCLLTGAAMAAPTVTMHKATDGVGSQPWLGFVGLEFDVLGSNFTVSQLGVYDSGNDGVIGNNTLTTVLFDVATRTIIAQETFDASNGAAANNYLFEEINPTVLAPGRYGIVSYGFGVDNPNGNTNLGDSQAIRAAELSFVQSIYSTGTDVTVPYSYWPTDAFHAPNMVFSVPAPGAILLGMFGTGLLGWLRSRRAL